MINEQYLRCNTLPAINETFAQFNRPIPLPLDLSQRVANSVPITPPSTPSPPRKRHRLMSEENQVWRPHAIRVPSALYPAPYIHEPHIVLSGTETASSVAMVTTTSTSYSAVAGNYFDNLTYAGLEVEQQTTNDYTNHSHNIKNNLVEIPEAKRSVLRQQSIPRQCSLPVVYVDEETIVLTEDEDETVVSSHECTEIAEDEETSSKNAENTKETEQGLNNDAQEQEQEEDEDEEYVDVLGNDDDDGANLLSANTILQLQNQILEEELEKSGKVLTRNKLVYDNEELHTQAVDGLAKLFERDFEPPLQKESSDAEQDATETTTIPQKPTIVGSQAATKAFHLPYYSNTTRSHPKAERKRVKLRKHMCVDEETISPVSGTIIRKLRDDEELVVRKGDIDPAFNVVEITDEAKAILASIDNKIGAYLCQLCRTLYDDAFKLAQHRCPRIVHIEYKCSECEKVFNCPANLASHRRWHKPKTELVTGQGKKRHVSEDVSVAAFSTTFVTADDSSDGNYACTQCDKIFRRQAYLKKHQASHQMLENLKPLDLYKKSAPNLASFASNANAVNAFAQRDQSEGSSYQPSNPYALKQYQKQLGAFPFSHLDQRRFYSLGQFYLSQQLERSSAFQYVQTEHLRNLPSAPGNFMTNPMVAPLFSMPVK